MTMPLDPNTTAVLSLDCQAGIVELVKGSERILETAAQVLALARARGVRVFHVGLGFRPGYPEVDPGHPSFGPISRTGRFVLGSESAQFHPKVAPHGDEPTIVKHRVSALHGTDLEMLLRAQKLSHLVLFGIATSGIVLSTLRQASDMDFRCTVVKDACFDGDDEVHRVLTEKVFPRQASVISAAELAARLAP